MQSKDGHDSPWTHSPRAVTLRDVYEAALKTLGQRIREKRKTLGWTQEELADQARLDRSYVGGIERGGRNITFTKLCQVCAALECDVASITRGLPGKADEVVADAGAVQRRKRRHVRRLAHGP